MSEAEELQEARRVLAFVFHRTNQGLFSFKRSERDKAISDVNYWTEQYRQFWQPPKPPARDRIWCGQRP